MAIDGTWLSSEEAFALIRALVSDDGEAERVALRALAKGKILTRGLHSLRLPEFSQPAEIDEDAPEVMPRKFWECISRAADTSGPYAGRGATSYCDWQCSEFVWQTEDGQLRQRYRGVIFDQAMTLTFASEYQRRGGQSVMSADEVQAWIFEFNGKNQKEAWPVYRDAFPKFRRVSKQAFERFWQQERKQSRGRPIGNASLRGNAENSL